jgi:hypothetical protein
MSMSVNSSSDALSAIQLLLQSVTNMAGNAAGIDPVGDFPGEASNGATASNGAPAGSQPFGMAGPPFPDGTMAALIALKGQDASGSGGPQGLFASLDSDGDGKVSQSEFETALSSSGVDTSSADALFAKLDSNGDGSIDQSELTPTSRGHGGHHHHMSTGASAGSGGGGGGGGLDALLNATGADGAQTQTAANADGSSTTTITYADGSTVTMTMPAPQSSSSPSAGGGSTAQSAANPDAANLIEQLIKMQSQLIAQQSATVSALA